MCPYGDGVTIHLVVNPTSGGGRGERILPTVLGQVRRTFAGRRVVVQRAIDYAHARQCVTEAVAHRTDDDVLVVMGGDGMMHLGINAVAGTGVPLGMIPAGSGDDLCRGLGIPVRDLDATLALLAGEPRQVDLLRVDEARTAPAGPSVGPTWVGSIVATGFDARVNLRANHMTFPPGRLQYPVAVAAELSTFRPLQYRLVVDGQPRELEAMLVAVGNTTSFGGGLRMCPEAVPDDGLLDLTIIHPVRRRTLVRMFPAIYRGAFTHLDEVELLRASTVELDGTLADGTPLTMMGDGEEIGAAPRTIRCAAGALTVFAPADLP